MDNQTNHFLTLTAWICLDLVEPPSRGGRGQKPVETKKLVFAILTKTGLCKSARDAWRFILDECTTSNEFSSLSVGTPHYNTVLSRLGDDETTSVLEAAVLGSRTWRSGMSEEWGVALPNRATSTRHARAGRSQDARRSAVVARNEALASEVCDNLRDSMFVSKTANELEEAEEARQSRIAPT